MADAPPVVDPALGQTGGTTPTQIPPEMLQQLIAGLIKQAVPAEQAQFQAGQAQLGLTGQQTGGAIGQAKQEEGWGEQSLGLQKTQQVDLPQQLLNFQKGQLPQQQGLTRDLQIGIPGAQLARQQALQPELYGIQQGQFGLQQQGYDLQGQGLDQQAEQTAYNAQRQLQEAMGSQAARGATNTVGAQRQLEDIAKQKGWSEADLSRARQNLGLSEQGLGLTEKQAGLVHGETMAGLSDEQKGLLDRTGLLDLSDKAQTFGLDQSQKQLDVVGKGLGLSGEELKGRLQNTIQNLGLSGQMTTQGILSGLAGQALGIPQQNLGLINQVAGTSFDKLGLPANVSLSDLQNMVSSGSLTPTPGIPPATKPPAPAAPAPAPKKTSTVKPTLPN